MNQIQVRSVRPDDVEGLRDLVSGLSPQSSFLRFWAGVGTPSTRLVTALLRRDDAHGAWVAERADRLLGHVSWARVAPGVVEVGAMVADGWQRRGLGRLLADRALAEAAELGAREVRLVVHGENRTLLKRLATGADRVRREDAGVVVDRPLVDLVSTRRDLLLVA